MPVCSSSELGAVDYLEQEVVEFAEGLPAFEGERRFIVIRRPGNEPLVYLQSLQTPDLLFLTLPPHQIVAAYAPEIPADDLSLLGLTGDRQPEQGREVEFLAMVSIGAGGVVLVNLMAPVVVNLATRQARQVIPMASDYSHQHILRPASTPC
jgi:flagellar assembly factor FliW